MHEGPPLVVDTEDNCVVISNEEDYNVCIPFLERGAYFSLSLCLPEQMSSRIVIEQVFAMSMIWVRIVRL